MQQERYSILEVASSPTTKYKSPKFVLPSEPNDQPEVAASKKPDHVALEEPPSASNDIRQRRKKWIVWVIVICVSTIAAVVGGVLGGVLSKHSSERKESTQSPAFASSNASPTAGVAATLTRGAMSGTAIALSSYSYPTAVSWGSSHLEVFALDTGVYPDWKYKDSTASAANEWSPENSTFEYIGSSTAPFQYGIAAIARDTQNVDIFITGSDFGLYHKSHSTNLAWVPSLTKWEAHGGMLSSAPSVVSWSSQRLDVFGIGEAPTYQLLQMTWDEGQWGGWIGHPAASMSAHAPAVVSWGPGRLDVFALSARDHALYYRYYDGKQWHPKDSLTNLGGYGTSRPVTISLQQGRIDIFMRGGDAGIWHNVYANATWSDWTAISVGKSVHTEPSVVSCVEGVIDLFAWAEDNSLIHKRLDIFTATWTPDTDFDKLRDGLAGPPSAVSDGAGSLHVFAYMQAGDLGHLSWNESSKTWSPGTGIESLGSGDWS